MRRVGQLSPAQASRTLAHRLAPRIDRLRQISTRLGVRPYNVNLVWGRWNGRARGEGVFSVIKSIPLLPNPKVEDLSAIALDPRSAGVLPVGSVRLTEISATYTHDMLIGLWVPTQPTDRLPENVEFFYELVEDGRGLDLNIGEMSTAGTPTSCPTTSCVCNTCTTGGSCGSVGALCPPPCIDPATIPDAGIGPMRGRYRAASEPMRRAEKIDWTIIIERVDEVRDREGREQIGPNRGLR